MTVGKCRLTFAYQGLEWGGLGENLGLRNTFDGVKHAA
jgi:hypothetical protein